MKSLMSMPGFVHVVGQIHDLAVAVVRTDQVGVADPAVVDRLARLHRGLQLLDHVAFLDQVVLDLDAGDLFKRLGQGLALVLVRGDGLADHADFLHALGLQLLGGFDEPLHLGHLLVLAQRAGLELAVDPLPGLGLAGPCALAQGQSGSGKGHGIQAQFHLKSPLMRFPTMSCGAGWEAVAGPLFDKPAEVNRAASRASVDGSQDT